MSNEARQQQEQLQQAIMLLDAQRALLGNAAVDAALRGLHDKLAQLDAPIPVPPLTDMEGERKLVTIMFADIANFTAMSERMDAEDVRQLLNDCFSELVPIVETFGGVVDKFIGDEIMALFGAPVTQENDAECALRAALAMMTALHQFNTRQQTNLGLHFGINTGIVIAGGIGSAKQQQYSVMGDAVNLAARLEDASATGEILVGHSTYQLTAQLFDFEVRPPIALKGKAKPVPIYQLLGLKETPGSTRGIPGLHSPMVGRTTQLQQLRLAVGALLQNQAGKVLAVIGEPGLGKSRLVSELRQTETTLHWIESRGQSFAQNVSYGVAQNLLNSIVGVSRLTPAAEVAQLFRHFLAQTVGDSADDIYPYLARLYDLPLTNDEESLVRSVVPEVMQQRMRQAFGELVIALTRTHPTLLVWEDLHWADPSSLQLIDYLTTLTTQHPLVMLLVFRPKEGLIWEYHQRWNDTIATYQSVLLTPLTDTDSEELINNLLIVDNLPAETRQTILSKAEGNPFFLEELLRSLLDAGMLLMQDGHIRAVDAIQQIIIPDTLHGVIESRIDRLTTQEKQTLQTASVIGRIFDQSVLSYLADRGKRLFITHTALEVLQERELIRLRELREYIFKHAVTQEVAYQSLLMSRRRELHRLAAQAIETLFPAQVDEFSPALAWHYQCAQATEQALYYLIRAAERAQRTYSHAEAAVFYRSALVMVMDQQTDTPDPLQLVRLSEQLGTELVFLGQFDEARQVYQQARQSLPAIYVLEHARLWRKEGESYVPQRQSLQELEQFEKAESVLGQAAPPTDTAWWTEWLDCQLARIWSLYWLNRSNDIAVLLAKVEPVLHQHGTDRQQAQFYHRLVIYQMRRDRYRLHQKTVLEAERALAAAYQAEDTGLIAIAQTLVGMANYYAGNVSVSESYFLRALSSNERTGDLQSTVITLQFLTQFYRYTDDVVRVRLFMTRMGEAIKVGKIGVYMFVVEGTKAWLAWKDGHQEDVERHAAASLALHVNVPIPNGFVLWLLIALHQTQNRLADAIPHLQNLLQPTQVALPDELEWAVRQTISTWENGDIEQAHMAMDQMINMAQAHRLMPATPDWTVRRA